MADRKRRGISTEKREETRGGQDTDNSSNSATDNKQGIRGQSESSNSGGSAEKQSSGIPKETLVSISSPPKPIIVSIPEGVQAVIPTTKAPRKNSRTKKEVVVSQNEISNLIMGCFSLVSLKAGEHWQVTEDESLQVAKPLENILKKLDLLEKVTNASDGAMLVFACVSIALPRILITKALSEENKKSKVEQLKGGGVIGTIQRIPDNEPEEKQAGSSEENSETDRERIKETESLVSKLNNPLYDTNAQ